MELRAAPNFALYPNFAAVPFHQVLGNRQAQTGAATSRERATSTRLEALKNSGLVGLRNANPGIETVNSTTEPWAQR